MKQKKIKKKKIPKFNCNKVSISIILVLVLQPLFPVLVSEVKFCHRLPKGEKTKKNPKTKPNQNK
jgi:hypothetical protein